MYMHYLVSLMAEQSVNACIISTSITVQYQWKVTNSRNKTPGWNRELDYARESSLFWKRMWIQCDKPISGVLYGLKCAMKPKHRHILRSLKNQGRHILNSPYTNAYLEITTRCTGMR